MSCILYRAVTQNEYDDIINLQNKFRAVRNTLEDKQFAINEKCGHYYGRDIVMRLDKVDYILLKVTVAKDFFCENSLTLDGCEAISIDRDLIDDFNKSIIALERIN